MCRPYGIVVNDTDCCAVEPGFESRRRHGVCKCIVPLRHGGTLFSQRSSSPLVWLVEGEESRTLKLNKGYWSHAQEYRDYLKELRAINRAPGIKTK
ncbi:hypothetical protein TNCV_2459321 [Trichonephila clavipes]|nr:hypothetical protein TNCV_2459321 [Trichonephila clavipes]